MSSLPCFTILDFVEQDVLTLSSLVTSSASNVRKMYNPPFEFFSDDVKDSGT